MRRYALYRVPVLVLLCIYFLKQFFVLPAGMTMDNAVADADLMTLVPGRALRFSPSAESCWWRTRRSTRSVAAPWGPCGSGSPRTAALPNGGACASAGLNTFSVTHGRDALGRRCRKATWRSLAFLLTSSRERVAVLKERPRVALRRGGHGARGSFQRHPPGGHRRLPAGGGQLGVHLQGGGQAVRVHEGGEASPGPRRRAVVALREGRLGAG